VPTPGGQLPPTPGIKPPAGGGPGSPKKPTPPVAPPPTTAPPTTPTPGTSPNPTGGRPVIPRPKVRDPLRGSRTGGAVNPDDMWQTWWTLNRLTLLPDRTDALRFAVITPGEDGAVGDLKSGWSQRRALLGQRHVVPLLLRLIDPKVRSRPDVVAASLLALGKVGSGRSIPEVIAPYLLDDHAPAIVRESAALALGLLARSDPTLQQDGPVLDKVRDQLFEAIDGKYAEEQTRCFAALALGLLGNQPFSEPYAKDGRLVIRAIWTRLENTEGHQDLAIAYLTALGMQPAAGFPDAVREGLRQMVAGRHVLGRRWDLNERSHALTAALRLHGPASHALLVRTLARPREANEIRRAAFIAIDEHAELMTPQEREEIARLTRDALRKSRDPLTTGLGHIALGSLLGADLREGSDEVFLKTQTAHELIAETVNGPTPTRGFSTLALALAMRDVHATQSDVHEFLADGARALVKGLEGGRGDDRLRAAYAVAIGVALVEEGHDALLAVIEDRHADPELRGHAAVAIGQLGKQSPEAQRALFAALAQRRDAELRRQAALGLALLGGRLVSTQLLRELETGKTEQLLAQVVIALGRLGDLEALGPLTAYASDTKRSELAQALGVAALGMITDPQPRPTLQRLTQHANYPARTPSLQEAFSIL